MPAALTTLPHFAASAFITAPNFSGVLGVMSAPRVVKRSLTSFIASTRVRGPKVVTLPDATMVIARGWTARALSVGGWLLERA